MSMPDDPDFTTDAGDDEEVEHPFGTPDEDGWMYVKREPGAGEPDSGSSPKRPKARRVAGKVKPRSTRRRR